jgi:hypothetical protein
VKSASSTAHSNVAGSSAVNVKRAVALSLAGSGPDVMVVSGGVRSIVQASEAGVGSTLPASSVARTRSS